ncbi:hypothetical protein [Shinella sp.]|uniref:hypothetical protein n=1 Tax=Shinella sp. TaxID=1870904 RepID=UPI003D2866E5
MKVTNTSQSRQGVHTTDGVVFIHPGQSRDVELTAAGEKFIDASDDLSIEGRTRKAAKPAATGERETPAE